MSAVTNAERQRAYRQRAKQEQGRARLTLWATKEVEEAIGHLAGAWGTDRGKAIERAVLLAADRVNSIDPQAEAAVCAVEVLTEIESALRTAIGRQFVERIG